MVYLSRTLSYISIINLAESSQASATDPVIVEAGAKKKGMILPFQPLTMTFHNVNYFVDTPQVWCYSFGFLLKILYSF